MFLRSSLLAVPEPRPRQPGGGGPALSPPPRGGGGTPALAHCVAFRIPVALLPKSPFRLLSPCCCPVPEPSRPYSGTFGALFWNLGGGVLGVGPLSTRCKLPCPQGYYWLQSRGPETRVSCFLLTAGPCMNAPTLSPFSAKLGKGTSSPKGENRILKLLRAFSVS